MLSLGVFYLEDGSSRYFRNVMNFYLLQGVISYTVVTLHYLAGPREIAGLESTPDVSYKLFRNARVYLHSATI